MARKDPISHLGRSSTPSDTLVREVAALGKAAVPRLCGLATNRAGWAPEETYDNKAARSAIFVLRMMRNADAIPALVEVLTEAPVDSRVVRSAAWALPGFGAAVIEPMLPHALEGSRWIEATEVLAECGVHDARIVERILALLAAAPGPGGDAALSYGDPALVPAVQAAFDAAFADAPPTAEAIRLLSALVETILKLGEPDEPRVRRVQLLMARFQSSVDAKRARVAELGATIAAIEASGVDVSHEGTLHRIADELKRLKD